MSGVTPEAFDLDALLAPVSEENPTGSDLREDYSPQSVYYRLRDARAEARATEREIDNGNPEYKNRDTRAEWRSIAALAPDALAGRSKDLEVAAWYTEALLRTEGLPGLTAGARLIAGLAERYWDDLFPRPDEDGIETLVGPVTGLNGQGGDGTLIQPLRKLALFSRPDGAPFTLWQYDQSADLAAVADEERRDARIAAGVVPMETAEAEARAAEAQARAMGRGHFGPFLTEARAAQAAWAEMAERLDARAGADSPPTGRVRDVLAHIVEIAARFAPADAAPAEAEERGQAAAPPPDEADPAVLAAASPAVPAPRGRVETREDALRRLGEIAEFFRRTEPHSPIAYTLEEAVRRGRLTWPELLAEIVPDPSSRAAILTTLGIRPAEE